jgi:hypothetical protein
MAASARDFDEACQRLQIPEALRKHVSAEAPSRGKLAVARGMLPAPPKALLGMMYVLLGDADPAVAEAAAQGISSWPADRLLPLLDGETHPKILEFLAYRRGADRKLVEKVVLLHQVNDKTLCYLAETGDERLAEMISNNQERLIITPQVIRYLERNAQVTRALVDRVRSFQRLYGIELPELSEDERAAAQAASAAAQSAAAQLAAAPLPATATSPPPAPALPPFPTPAPPSAPPPSAGEAPFPTAGVEPTPGGAPPGLAADAWGQLPSGADAGLTYPEAPPWAGIPEDAPAAPALPPDFVPGEVYIPAAPTEPYLPPPGLLNPLAALLLDWGIPLRDDFVVPPDDPLAWEPAETDVGGAPVLDAVSAFSASAVDVAGIGSADGGELGSMTSLAGSEFRFDFAEEGDEFGAEFTQDDDSADEARKLNLSQQISRMTTGQKIKLAYKGNKAVRELLVRDSNKIVAAAVVKSGRITENEVLSIATNRAVNEDVIRALCEDAEYLRKYPVKVALVNNPKTPIPTAIGMIRGLAVKDLKRLAANRNVSSAVFSAAGKLYKQRKDTASAEKGG